MYHKNSFYGKRIMVRSGIQILEATIGVEAGTRSLFPRLPPPVEVPSLLTDFREVREIPCPARPDGRIVLMGTRSKQAEYVRCGRKAVFRGPLLELEKKASDPRFSLWGNQGFLYRFVLHLLESRHRIFSFHAAGLYEERANRLFVVAGGAGSGKTVYLLNGIRKGLSLFSTETVHFRFENEGLTWMKGSLVDNIRLGSLIYDFHEFCPPELAGITGDAVWRNKIAIDLSARQSTQDRLVDPRLVLIFPRIEEGRPGCLARPMADPDLAAKSVFDNLSQKIAESVVLYDCLPVPGFDTAALAGARLKAARTLVGHGTVARIASVLSNPAECWGDLME